MRRFIILLIGFLSATQSVASEPCEDLWFSRNLVFDQAGYCFGSPLGKAIFDNSDCTTTSPVLSADDKGFVKWIKSKESEWDCKVDTSRSTFSEFDIDTIPLRRMLTHPVARSGFESTCIGWRGEAITLYADFTRGDFPIGVIRPGDTIYWAYDYYGEPDHWDFLTRIDKAGKTTTMGWSNVRVDPDKCDAFAG